MIDVLLKLTLRSILVVEDLPHFFEVLEWAPQERVEPIEGDALEAGWEHAAQAAIFVGVNHHLVLVLSKMLDRVGRSGVAVEAWHYEFLREVVRDDFLQELCVGSPQVAW